MKSVLIAFAVYPAFFGCIAFACYITNSAWPLFALFLTPRLTEDKVDDT
jgi:hypothetical protein